MQQYSYTFNHFSNQEIVKSEHRPRAFFSAGKGHDPTKMYQTPFLLEHYGDPPFTDATWLGQKFAPNSI